MIAPLWLALALTQAAPAEVTVLVQHGRWLWAGVAISAHVAGSVALTLLGCATAQYLSRG